MPKVIPVEDKRVPLNCLVPPPVLAAIKSMAVGRSQGDVVAAGIAALLMEEAQGRIRSYTPAIEAKIKTNVTPRPFRGPILKPSERK